MIADKNTHTHLAKPPLLQKAVERIVLVHFGGVDEDPNLVAQAGSNL